MILSNKKKIFSLIQKLQRSYMVIQVGMSPETLNFMKTFNVPLERNEMEEILKSLKVRIALLSNQKEFKIGPDLNYIDLIKFPITSESEIFFVDGKNFFNFFFLNLFV